DPMNADETLLRSRVRHRALPLLREILGEHLDENLARTADLVGPDADHLDAEATALLDSLRRDGGELREERDLLLLDVHALAAAPAPLRTRVLRDASRSADRAMARHGGAGSTKSLLRRQVLAIDALVVSWHGQSAVTVPGRIAAARRDGLLVWRRIDSSTAACAPPPVPWRRSACPRRTPTPMSTACCWTSSRSAIGSPRSDGRSPTTTRTSRRSSSACCAVR